MTVRPEFHVQTLPTNLHAAAIGESSTETFSDIVPTSYKPDC